MTKIHAWVEALNNGTFSKERIIKRMKSGWAIAGERQVLAGYSLLIPDPVVPDLNALKGASRTQFLQDYIALGDAVLAATKCLRINYEVLGNLEPALHAHVFARYSEEAQSLKTKPIWFYDWDQAPLFDSKLHGELFHAIQSKLS